MKICDQCEQVQELPSGAPATPALASLRLDDQAMASLAQQGFVRTEWRGQRGPYFRLRFRVGRRQRSRYLGQDAAFAHQVRKELAELQAPRRLDLELHHASRQTRQFLRRKKVLLEDGIRAHGGSFHGLRVRLPASIPKPAPRSAVTAVLVLSDGVRSMSDTSDNRSNDSDINERTGPDVNESTGAEASDRTGPQANERTAAEIIEPSCPVVPPAGITSSVPPPAKPLETGATEGGLPDGLEKADSKFRHQVDDVLDEAWELALLLARRIKSAMHGNHSQVKDFGRLPAAYNCFNGLTSQFRSLGQLKLQIDKQSEN